MKSGYTMSCLAATLALGIFSAGCSSPANHSNNILGAKRSTASKGGLTKYPTVLLHGFIGFNKILFIDYFYRVPEALKAEGYAVYVTQVPMINSIELRTSKLAPQIDAILQETGATKVNLIGHSMGGLDARQLISTMGYGDRIASVTQIGSPNQGSPIADLVLGLLDKNQEVEDGINSVFKAASDLVESDSSLAAFGPVDLQASLTALSVARAASFDSNHPDDARVYYQSYGGIASLIQKGPIDILDPILKLTVDYVSKTEGANDGIVSVNSSRHGVDLGVIPCDHLEEIGQPIGREPAVAGFSYQAFYASILDDLAVRGF